MTKGKQMKIVELMFKYLLICCPGGRCLEGWGAERKASKPQTQAKPRRL